MQRVRIGLTGLASVFLLVLAAAVFTKGSDEEPITADRIEEVVTDGQSAAVDAGDESNEPLADLGIVPGTAPADGNTATADTVQVEDPLKVQRRR